MTDQITSNAPQFKTDREAALAAYRENGFHIEYGVWQPAEMERINGGAAALRERTQADFRPLMHPHREDPLFLSAIRKPEMVDLMEWFLGGEISGLQTEYFFGRPGTRGFARHQDNFYVEAEQHSFGSAWSAMTDVSPENGGLFVYPGTHLEPLLKTEKLEGGAGPNQDPNASNEDCIVPERFTAVDVTLPAGALVVLHGHLVHGSHANVSDRGREALLCTYILKGRKFRAGNYARRTEIPLRTAQ